MSAVPATLAELRSNQLAPVPQREVSVGFTSMAGFELLQRGAKSLASSTLVPQQFQGNIANCMIALNMAHRIGADPLLVMQNLYIVHGRPGWSSQFLIATFNTNGKYTALRYEFFGEKGKPSWGCRAWAIERESGERLVGSDITIQLANDEGWSTKKDSKWKTMPQQMLMYRAAAFFIRAYAPELAMGLMTRDELDDGVIDMVPTEARQRTTVEQIASARVTAEPAKQSPEAGDDDPAVEPPTHAEVLAAINTAKTRDELDTAASLIGAIGDEQQRAELTARYQARLKEFEQ